MATYESRRYNTPVPDVTKVADGSVSNTEFEHLDGVTSDIQTQLTSKLPLAGGTMSGNLDFEDAVRARFGTGSDLNIKHDGSNGNISNSTGALVVNADTIQFKNLADNATFLTLNSSSSFLSLADVYPVGSIYTNAVNSTNPSSLLGFGTWARFGEGRMLVSQDGGDSDFNTGEETGGAKTHTLVEDNLPAHTHTFSGWSMGQGIRHQDGVDHIPQRGDQGSASGTFTSSSVGSADAVTHMNPYIVVYMWKRTA